MQWIDSWCPSCFSNCIRIIYVSFSKKFGHKKKSYQGLNQLQEEQFRFKQKSERKIFPEKYQTKETQQISLNEDLKKSNHNIELQVKLLLNEKPQTQIINFKREQEQKTNNIQQKQINDNTNDYEKFKINIDPFSPYYGFVEQKIQNSKNMKLLLQIKGQQIQIGITPSNMKLYQSQSNIGLKYLITYNLPCSYSFYSNLMLGTTSKQFNPLVQDSLLLQTIQPNLRIHYLSFGKFMMLQARQFTYLKYIYGTDNQHWQVCISINQKQGSEIQIKSKQKICGELFTLTHVKQINDDKGVNLVVRSYCFVDLKLPYKNPKIINRGQAQIKNYIDNLYQHCKNNFQEQLA